MNRVFISLVLLMLLCGCSKEQYFVCNSNFYNEVDNYTYKATYKVYYKNSFVTKIEKDEQYLSDNKDILKYFNEFKNLEYKSFYDLYGGITYDINLKNNKVILNSIIDMNLVDIKQMIKNKYIDKDYIISNKLTIGGIKKIYKEKGAKCN